MHEMGPERCVDRSKINLLFPEYFIFYILYINMAMPIGLVRKSISIVNLPDRTSA